MRTANLGSSSMSFEIGIHRDGECLISGELVYVNTNPVAKISRLLPKKLRRTIEVYAAGWQAVQGTSRVSRASVGNGSRGRRTG
jgi:hypothetical protein